MRYFETEEYLLTSGASTSWTDLSVEGFVPNNTVFVMLKIIKNDQLDSLRLIKLSRGFLIEYKVPNLTVKVDIVLIGFAVEEHFDGLNEIGIRTNNDN